MSKILDSPNPLIFSIDPSGMGTSGIWVCYNNNSNFTARKMTEIEADNPYDAVTQIMEYIEKIQSECGSIEYFAVEECYIPKAHQSDKNKQVPLQVRKTIELIGMLKILFGSKYVGLQPDWKDKEEYKAIKNDKYRWQNFKKSEHIVDAYLLCERMKKTIRKNLTYYDLRGNLRGGKNGNN
ncbi:hypothetical protein [Spiroplasma endosymbiont of Labia minor]|uniref:hypothetical protein n=1 Tax=Spiroplasma endosymbiont of Labia minor TaxID=3066305 RepID=UPI0030D1E039